MLGLNDCFSDKVSFALTQLYLPFLKKAVGEDNECTWFNPCKLAVQSVICPVVLVSDIFISVTFLISPTKLSNFNSNT